VDIEPGERRRTRRAALALAFALAFGWRHGSGEEMPAYHVVVHPENPVASLDRRALARIFLKNTTRWEHDGEIHPVDQSPQSEVRRRFDEEVLGRSVAAVRNAWQQAIFSGRDVPPPELGSDAMVLDYVRRDPQAIGYVSGKAELRGARAIPVR